GVEVLGPDHLRGHPVDNLAGDAAIEYMGKLEAGGLEIAENSGYRRAHSTKAKQGNVHDNRVQGAGEQVTGCGLQGTGNRESGKWELGSGNGELGSGDGLRSGLRRRLGPVRRRDSSLCLEATDGFAWNLPTAPPGSNRRVRLEPTASPGTYGF